MKIKFKPKLKIKINRQQFTAGITVIAAVVLVYLGGYYFFITPAQANVNELENQLGIQEELISGAGLSDEEVLTSSTVLQEKIPVVKATDQMLLKIRQIESESEAVIRSLSVVSVNEQSAEVTGEANLLPEEIKPIDYYLEARAENYQQMDQFLKKLTSMERLIDLKVVQFGKETEDQLVFTVAFSSYYVPSLKALSSEGPDAAYQAPAGKASPFQE